MASSPPIWEGFWINWSIGPVRGVVLTVSNTKASYLIAVIAIFVSIVGGSFWQLVAHSLFLQRSASGCPSAKTRYQKAVLRNTTSPFDVVFNLLDHCWACRHSDAISYRSTLVITLAAVTSWSAFIVAGVFSARVTTTWSEVLIQPTNCGSFDRTYHTASRHHTAILDAQAQLHETISNAGRSVQLAASNLFASICYNGTTSRNDCIPFGRREPTMRASTVECPFDRHICVGEGPIKLYTRIDSDRHLGVNSRPEDRLSLDLCLSCSPLATRNYTAYFDRNNISDLVDVKEIDELLNPQPIHDVGFRAFYYGNKSEGIFPATFLYNNETSSRSAGGNSQYPTYILDVATWAPNITTGFFDAIPALRVEDATVQLIFLSKHVQYSGSIQDPVFRATTNRTTRTIKAKGEYEHYTFWYPNEPVSIIGCVQKTELCTNDQCVWLKQDGGLIAVGRDTNLTTALSLNSRQASIAKRMQKALNGNQIRLLPRALGSAVLLAQQYVMDNSSAPLPDNQWELEVQHWFAVITVGLQVAMQQYPIGLPKAEWNGQYLRSPEVGERWMCHNQIMRRTDYSSFSVLGIILILIVGLLIIAINIKVSWVDGRHKKISKQDHSCSRTHEWQYYGLSDILERSLSSGQTPSVNATSYTRCQAQVPEPHRSTLETSQITKSPANVLRMQPRRDSF